jgi:hypothetical protein
VDSPTLGILLMLFGPAVIGVIALVAALLFLGPPKGKEPAQSR